MEEKDCDMLSCIKKSSGREIIFTYNELNLCIYSKETDEDGYVSEKWNEYDEQNRLVHQKHSDGTEIFYEYDHFGNVCYRRDSCGYEERWEYIAKGKCVHYKDNMPRRIGFEWWKKYDERGNCIYYKNSTNNEERYEYIQNGKLHNTIIEDTECR